MPHYPDAVPAVREGLVLYPLSRDQIRTKPRSHGVQAIKYEYNVSVSVFTLVHNRSKNPVGHLDMGRVEVSML